MEVYVSITDRTTEAYGLALALVVFFVSGAIALTAYYTRREPSATGDPPPR